MDLYEIIRCVRRRFLVFAIVAVAVIAAGAAYALTQKQTYESTTTLQFGPKKETVLTPTESQSDSTTGTTTVINPAITFAWDKVSGTQISNAAHDAVRPSWLKKHVTSTLPFDISEEQLASQVSANPVNDTTLLNITGRSTDPRQAEQISHAVASGIQSDVTLNSQFATVASDFTTDKAKRSSLPTYLTVIAIDIAGLLLGVVAALLWDRLFPRITDARSLCEAAGMPVLGVLPSHPAVNKEPRAFVGAEPVTILEDPIRMVLANLTVPQREARARSLAVVGMTSRSGASAVAANLAIVTAELGSTVLLVDADLRKPSLSTIFDVAAGPGLSSVTDAEDDLTKIAHQTTYPRVGVVPAGDAPDSRAQESEVYYRQLPRFEGMTDLVVVLARPLRAGPETRLVMGVVDEVVLVVESGALRPREVEEAVAGLRMLGIHLAGAVLTGAPKREARRWRYGYGVRRVGEPLGLPAGEVGLGPAAT
jgi:succinoglycan biosynthesis transport protein ExoP